MEREVFNKTLDWPAFFEKQKEITSISNEDKLLIAIFLRTKRLSAEEAIANFGPRPAQR